MSSVSEHTSVAMLIEVRQLLDAGQLQVAAARLAECEAADAFVSPVDQARLLSLKCTIQYRRAEYSLAIATAEAGLSLVKTTGENDLIAELQSTTAQSLVELGRISEAERVYRDLVSTYRRLDNTVGIIKSLNRLSRVHFIQGRFDKAVECLLEATDYAERVTDRKWLAMIKGNLGTILNLTGEFPNAVEFLTESAELNRSLNNRLNLCRSHLSLAFARMHLKDYRAAAENLSLAAGMIDQSDYRSERVTLNQYRALLALLNSETDEAMIHARAALEQARKSAAEGASVCQLQRIIAEAQYRAGVPRNAAKSAATALKAARMIGEKLEQGACERLLAVTALSSDEAETHFAESVNLLSQCGARFELAQTYVAWSRSAADHSLKAEYRHMAARIFSSLNLEGLYLSKPKVENNGKTGEIAIIGDHDAFADLVRQAAVCAESDIPVLLLGETGSGKDQFARFIHHRSDRGKGPLIQVNCAAIPLELAESELFGYEKGAFTNASDSKIGLIEAANGGTLFLNEIGDLPLPLQTKLLAALEEKRFFKLGSTVAKNVDFRLIAATNVDLTQAVRDGKFRSDLYYRLAVVTLSVPALATRGDDAFRLFQFFMELEQIGLENVAAETLAALQTSCRRYSWPGNVRELKNYVELYALTEHRDAEAICRRLNARLEPKVEKVTELEGPLNLQAEVERFEMSRIDQALEKCGGVIRRTANFLGLPEATLRSKMKKYRISAA